MRRCGSLAGPAPSAVLLGCLFGCPAATPQIGGLDFECASLDDCAQGYLCVEGHCVAAGSAALDAASLEAARADTARSDHAGLEQQGLDGAPLDGAGERPLGSDAGAPDRPASDMQLSFDAAGATDGGPPDLGAGDAGPQDQLAPDQRTPDTAALDASLPDQVPADAAAADLGSPDTVVEDTSPPPPILDGFAALTGGTPGTIALHLDFPDDTRGFGQVQIRRAVGSTPPDCDSGDVVATLGVGEFADLDLSDSGLVELETYSYRACVDDVAGAPAASPVATADAMGCWWEGLPTIYTDLQASIVDAWAGQWRPSSADPERRILASSVFVAGDRIRLGASSGRSICRIYANQVECAVDCPGGWKLFFKDSGGQVLWSAGQVENLADFGGGVAIPAGAASAWIGYRDGPCVTGSDCSGQGDPYFDNCDNRLVNGSCERCNFELYYEVQVCNGP